MSISDICFLDSYLKSNCKWVVLSCLLIGEWNMIPGQESILPITFW